MDIEQILRKIKDNRQVDSSSVNNLKNYLKQKNIKELNLWANSSNFRFLMGAAKAQIYLIAFVGLTAFPYLMYQKYLKQPQKAQSYAIATPLVCVLFLTPLLYFRRVSKRLIKGIAYDPLSRQFILQPLTKGKPIRVLPEHINATLTKNKRIKSIQVKQPGLSQAKYSIEGIGEWQSIEIFKHILQRKQL